MKKLWVDTRWRSKTRRKENRRRRRAARKAKHPRSTDPKPPEMPRTPPMDPKAIRSNRRPVRPWRLVSVRAPAQMSLTCSPQETLRFFHDLDTKAIRFDRVFVDLESVEELTPDAILYTLSRVKHHAMRGVVFSGNAPADATCRELWVQSGFYNYVNAGIKTPANPDILSIKSGVQVDSDVAGLVIEFAAHHLGLNPEGDLEPAYVAIVECMTNTLHHASGNPKRPCEWHVIARRYPATGEVQFAILDSGQGIPETVRNTVLETWVTRPLRLQEDFELIRSALTSQGRRSRMGQRHRGRGLPKICSFAQAGKIRDLRVLSRRGFVDIGAGVFYDLPNNLRFQGTLLAWSFVTA